MLPIFGARRRASFVPLACCALAACGSGDGFVRQRRRGRPAGAELRLDPSQHLRAALRALPFGRERAGRLAARRREQLRAARRRRERRAAEPPARRAGRSEQQLPDPEARRHGRRRRAHAGRSARRAASRHQHHSAVDRRRRAAELVGVRADPRHVAVAGAELDGARAAGLDHGRLQPRGQRAVRHDGDVHAATRRRRRRARHGRRRRDHAGVGDRARARTRARPS